jgi:hypothetical protein
MIPLLKKDVANVRAMLDATGEQLAALDIEPAPFANGQPEQTLVWEEPGGVVCRARLDYLHDDHSTIDDFKTTAGSAEPDRWTRTLFAIGSDIQTSFYRRGVQMLTGAIPDMRYFVQETYPPYALSVVSLAPAALSLADAKVQWAIDRWRLCLERDFWAGYPADVCFVEAPAYEEMRWADKEAREAA